MDAPALAVESLGKSFGPVRAVDDLTFTVQPGRVTGFLGPNGSGKTTTLRHVLGEVQHTVDDVVVIARGRLVHASPLTELAALAGARTYVESPSPESVRALCAAQGWEVVESGRGLEVDAPASAVGAAAYSSGVELHQLATRGADLEDVFLRLTGAVA